MATRRLQRTIADHRRERGIRGVEPPRGSQSASSRREATPASTARTLARRVGDQRARRILAPPDPGGTAVSAVQPKLAINTPGDAYEREADRVADAVVSGAPSSASMRGPATALQRCACGGSCPACRAKREGEEELHRDDAGGSAAPAFAPPVVHDVLSSPGRPLDGETRGVMESRIGADFGGVRVHTDARAAESAAAVSAHAYTVGNHIAFAAGRYAPGSREGDRLLAHELAHTVQQSGGDRRVQRFVSCETGESCPPRVSGETGRAGRTPMFVGGVSGSDQGLLVANFAVGGGDVKRDLQSNPAWANFWGQMVANPNIRWEILGFSDCSGNEPRNELIRWERATAVNNALPQLARDQVDGFSAAPLSDCIASNADEQGRTYNRSAFIRQVSTEYTFPEETITRTLPGGPFLDLQIACVTDAGGCSNPAGIAAMDRRCRGETGYGGQPLMVLDLVCGTPGMGIAQSLDRAYPTWRSVIPDCPCSRADADAAPDFSRDLNPFLSRFHPGAEACFRSDPVASVPGTAHRQQCCYTASGSLITSGAGAGTPDVWDPFFRHQRIDVQPFNEFGKDFRIYNRFWIPNAGAGCAAAP